MLEGLLILISSILCGCVPLEPLNNSAEWMDTTLVALDTTVAALDTTTVRSPLRQSVYKVPKKSRHLTDQQHPVPDSKVRWVADVLQEALGTFVPSGGSTVCQTHSQLYRSGLQNLTLWAVQMHDASAHSASGLLPGQAYHMGHFDECVSLEVSPLGVAGRYCLADIQFSPDYPGFNTPHPQPKYTPPNNQHSAWERIKLSSDLSHRRRDQVHWAVCVPASCSSTVVETSMKQGLQTTSGGMTFNLTLGERRCYARQDETPIPIGVFIVLAVFCLAGTVASIATGMDFFVYQAERPHNRNIRRWLRPFSMYKNMGKLVTPNPDTEFAEFHVYKLIAILFVVSGHRQMYNIGQTPLFNVDWVEELNSYFIDIVILNGGVVVDTFFLLSGFLTCHYMLRELDKYKRFNFPVVLFNRWIRIAPVYMLVVSFYMYVFPRLGDGPLWTERLSLEAQRCQTNWWTNLLFINNYINSDNQCMVQSWYLACDMQFFVFGSLLVYCLWRWPRLGQSLLGLSLTLTIALPAAITYYNRYYGAVLHYMSLMKDPMSVQHYRDMYIPSHTRAGPYVVGIITASVYLKLKKADFKFSQLSQVIGSLVSGVLLLASIMVGWICYDRSRPYGLLENTIYAGTHRSVWALGLAWFIVAEGTTGFGVFYRTVKHRFFTPFGRLTYCVFLVHTIPQIYLTSSSRLPEHLTVPKLFWIVTGDATAAYILALYVNLLFEAPLERLQKKMIKRFMKGKEKSKPENINLGISTINGLKNQGMEKEN